MLRPAIGKVLVLCAALSLPALAIAPAGAAVPAAKSARVIVKFKSDGALMRESALAVRGGELPRVQHAARLSQRFGVPLADGYPVGPRTQVLHARGMSSADLVARLQADPDVEYAEVDVRVHRAEVPNDPLYGTPPGGATPVAGQWYLRPPTAQFVSAIDAQSAWDVTTGSSALVVAVLDTGVRPNHPDLIGKLLPGYDFVTPDSPGVFATANDNDGRDTDPSDPGDWVTPAEANFPGGPLQGCEDGPSSWHGTQTAALIGASTNNGTGMASVGRNVRVLPVRVLGKCGGFQSDVVAAMYWAAGLTIPPASSDLGTAPPNANPAKVLNLSLGSSAPCSQLYRDAVAAVIAAGASVVVSAGNDVGQAVGQPANCPGAIGVGGLRHVGTKVGFSDVGAEIAISAPAGNCVNEFGACLFPILTATNSGTTVPAGDTYSDSDNFSVGTSFSAPLVAGTAALMLSANSALSPSQVRVGLMRTSRAFPASGSGAGVPVCRAPDAIEQDECYCTSSTCGAGMLNAANAVSAAAALRAWIVPSATQVPVQGSVTLSSTNSWAAPPRSITSRMWEISSGSDFASLQGTSAPTAALAASAPGTVVVRLTVGDGVSSSFDEATIVIANPSPPASGGGGGALSWPWLLALFFAVALLRPRRAL